MKFSIKKAGVLFAILVVIVLAVTGVLLGTTNGKNFGLADSVVTAVEQTDEPQIPEISETIELDGTNLAEQSAKWSTAVTSALTGKHVLVKLINDWNATADGFVTADTTGFKNKIINVPTNATITLDLNGKTIDRNLKDYKNNGSIFVVNGTFIIKDSAYDGETIINEYNNNNYQGEYKFRELSCGKINGGRNSGSGGAVKVDNGTFIMDGGMLMDNRANEYGGAIYATNNSHVIINHGVFYRNMVEGNDGFCGGGVIYISVKTKFDFYNGIMNKNSANRIGTDDGGAIAVRNGEVNIYDGIFSNNFADDCGGVMVSRGGKINISGGKYEYNRGFAGGAFYFARGTESVNITNAYIANNTGINKCSAIYGSIDSGYTTEIYLSDTIIKDNQSTMLGAIGKYFDLTLGKNVQIYDNYAGGNPGDLCLELSARVKCSEDLGDSKIGITISSDYTGGDVVASDYTTYNSNPPYNYFFSNQYASIATTKGNDVTFDKTISGGNYDFVYLDGGKRVNYKDTDYIHTTNDFELRKNVNGGNMVLGSITCGTSVNRFLQNLNFADNRIKLYDNKNNVIYDYSQTQTGFNHLYDDGANLAIGTGWYLEVYSQSNSIVETVYLSVLGDVTGDGKINSLDVTYLRRMINDPKLYTNLNSKPYIQLASLIVNKNGLVNTDCDILWQVVCNKMDIKSFF